MLKLSNASPFAGTENGYSLNLRSLDGVEPSFVVFLFKESRRLASKESPNPFICFDECPAGDLLLSSLDCGNRHASFELLENGADGILAGRIVSPTETEARPDLCALAAPVGHCPRFADAGESPKASSEYFPLIGLDGRPRRIGAIAWSTVSRA